MSRIWFPQCYWCKHFHAHTAMEYVKRCDAFPEGLPIEIFNGYFDHQQPYLYADDRGVQFEEQPDMKALPEFLQEMTDEAGQMIRKMMYDAMQEKIRSLKGKKYRPDPTRYE